MYFPHSKMLLYFLPLFFTAVGARMVPTTSQPPIPTTLLNSLINSSVAAVVLPYEVSSQLTTGVVSQFLANQNLILSLMSKTPMAVSGTQFSSFIFTLTNTSSTAALSQNILSFNTFLHQSIYYFDNIQLKQNASINFISNITQSVNSTLLYTMNTTSLSIQSLVSNSVNYNKLIAYSAYTQVLAISALYTPKIANSLFGGITKSYAASQSATNALSWTTLTAGESSGDVSLKILTKFFEDSLKAADTSNLQLSSSAISLVMSQINFANFTVVAAYGAASNQSFNSSAYNFLSLLQCSINGTGPDWTYLASLPTGGASLLNITNVANWASGFTGVTFANRGLMGTSAYNMIFNSATINSSGKKTYYLILGSGTLAPRETPLIKRH